jgi:uncharacterized membrane-anchored protein
MKKCIVFCLAIIFSHHLFAGDEDTLANKLEQYVRYIDSVNKAMRYETGQITLSDGIAELNVPQGFKFLNAEQSQFVLSELWGNPPDRGVLGMIFPEDGGPMADSSYAFVVTYDELGYVKDKEADEIDYDQMLKDIHKSEAEDNAERRKNGYGSIHMVGWASKPFYDKTNKVLHWAKELQFEGSDASTLNYDVRILGRKGVLSLNAVAGMSELPLVKQDIDKVLHIAKFTAGNTYADFDSNIDKVAAITIGTLVAGKVLAKAGFLAVIIKFGKFIIIGIAALGGAILKFFKRKKSSELAYDTPQPTHDDQQASI